MIAPHISLHQHPSGLPIPMVRILAGSFMMGSKDEEAYEDEQPVHRVEVSSFSLGQYPVTQALWQAVMGENPSGFEGAERSVETVSWDDCQRFLKELNAQTDGNYRLPTEAEWEYAARGGAISEGYRYAGSDELEEVGWYIRNSGEETHPVGQLLPNELGLYDLSGNVYEWCEDDWHDTYDGAPLDGSAWVDQPQRASLRVLRGGNWIFTARYCRVSNRYLYSPGYRYGIIGLRLASP
ncbi:MAG: formylglycine-generating enzyme family protein [Bacteroidota bacterium]